MHGLRRAQRPQNAKAGAEGRQRPLAAGVARQLQRALPADGGLGVLREGGAAVDFREDGQVTLRSGDGLEGAQRCQS